MSWVALGSTLHRPMLSSALCLPPIPPPSTPHPKDTLFPGEGPVPRNPCSTIPVPEVDVGFPTGDNAAAVTRVEANGED